MKRETSQYLEKARQTPVHARAILAIELGEEAGRGVARTHRGVHGQFLRLTADEPSIDEELRRFLAEGYKLKATADYETGPDASVPLAQAAEAIAIAERFVDALARLIGDLAPRLP